jgi:UPF0176 protein
MPTTVLLYYKYVHVPDPEAQRLVQRALCEELGLKGRILLAEEGINGTVAGTMEATVAYIAAMNAHPYFSGIDYKQDQAPSMPFPRLRIRVRPEIVTLGVDIDPSLAAPKLTPAQFHDLINDPNVILFDARNNFESAIGRFKGAVTPDLPLFKNLPETLDTYEDLKDKTIVTYCTGGIRCEKASALMRQRGFKDVYQLDGGIINYAQTFPDGQFEGECFVFDERMSVAFQDEPAMLGSCHYCNAPTNTYANCTDRTCNELFLICTNCTAAAMTLCQSCQTALV